MIEAHPFPENQDPLFAIAVLVELEQWVALVSGVMVDHPVSDKDFVRKDVLGPVMAEHCVPVLVCRACESTLLVANTTETSLLATGMSSAIAHVRAEHDQEFMYRVGQRRGAYEPVGK